MNYYEKYLKYKLKYLRFYNNEQTTILEGGSKFTCMPEQEKYLKICTSDKNGKYKTLKKCFNDCESNFIQSQLKKAKIYNESMQFNLFIKDMVHKEHVNIYIKGGNVIGLALLELIYSQYKNDNQKFTEAFTKFLNLELIKDWDFSAYMHNKVITDQYRIKLDTIALKYKLVPRAKTFILYQTKNPILIYDKALFEIAILDSDSNEYSKMEIPLTTMKIKVTEFNLKYIFMLAKSFYMYSKYNISIDLDIVKKILSQINIFIHPHKFGLYDPKDSIDKGDINCDLFEFIDKFTNHSIYLNQFFITQLEDPYRLIYRLYDKNFVKTLNIINFIKKELPQCKKPQWLLNVKYIKKITNKFIKKLGIKLADIYKETKSIDKVLEFLSGTNFGKPQIQIEWKVFNLDTKNRLKDIFNPVVTKIGIENLKKIIESNGLNNVKNTNEITNSNKILKLLKFLINENLFNE